MFPYEHVVLFSFVYGILFYPFLVGASLGFLVISRVKRAAPAVQSVLYITEMRHYAISTEKTLESLETQAVITHFVCSDEETCVVVEDWRILSSHTFQKEVLGFYQRWWYEKKKIRRKVNQRLGENMLKWVKSIWAEYFCYTLMLKW